MVLRPCARELDAAREPELRESRIELRVRHAEIALPRHRSIPLAVVTGIVVEPRIEQIAGVNGVRPEPLTALDHRVVVRVGFGVAGWVADRRDAVGQRDQRVVAVKSRIFAA